MNQYCYTGNDGTNDLDPMGLWNGRQFTYNLLNFLTGGYGDAANKQWTKIDEGCGDYYALVCDTMMAGWNSLGWVDGIGEGKSLAMCIINKTGCFPANTPVQMANGTKPIQMVKKGDKIRSRNPKTGKDEIKTVVRTFVHYHIPTLVLQFSNGDKIETTAPHPFYVDGKGFVPAGKLAVGNAIVTRAGPATKIVSIRHKRGGSTVYNLEVADDHTYFVGKVDGGEWVHNACLSKIVEEGTRLFRVWGGKSGPFGRSWTRIDPATIENYRDAAGLPASNTGRFLSEGTLNDASGVTTQDATPLDGNAGGLDEVVVPSPETQISLTNVSGVNPEF